MSRKKKCQFFSVGTIQHSVGLRDHSDRLQDHLGRVQGWESVCWEVPRIPLVANRKSFQDLSNFYFMFFDRYSVHIQDLGEKLGGSSAFPGAWLFEIHENEVYVFAEKTVPRLSKKTMFRFSDMKNIISQGCSQNSSCVCCRILVINTGSEGPDSVKLPEVPKII